MNKTIFFITLLSAILLSGCAIDSVFNLGKNESKAEEMGCDYSDAGVPIDPYYVLHHKKEIGNKAYLETNCKPNQEEEF